MSSSIVKLIHIMNANSVLQSRVLIANKTNEMMSLQCVVYTRLCSVKKALRDYERASA